jgi:hypothetical protein
MICFSTKLEVAYKCCKVCFLALLSYFKLCYAVDCTGIFLGEGGVYNLFFDT